MNRRTRADGVQAKIFLGRSIDCNGRRRSRAGARRQRLGVIGCQGFQATAAAERQVPKFNYYIAD
jgi:hypothetical protein